MAQEGPEFRINRFRLKRLREQLGYTQGQLAKYSGVSQAHISNLERGYTTDAGAECITTVA